MSADRDLVVTYKIRLPYYGKVEHLPKHTQAVRRALEVSLHSQVDVELDEFEDRQIAPRASQTPPVGDRPSAPSNGAESAQEQPTRPTEAIGLSRFAKIPMSEPQPKPIREELIQDALTAVNAGMLGWVFGSVDGPRAYHRGGTVYLTRAETGVLVRRLRERGITPP